MMKFLKSMKMLFSDSRRWRMYMAIFAVCLGTLAGCGKKDAIPLPAEHRDLLGVWEKVEVKDNGLVVDNLLLAFHQDNTVTLVTCKKKPGSHSSITFPGASLVKFEGGQLDIQVDFVFGAVTEHVKIDQFPYQAQGQTYLQANGKTLRKLLEHEQSDYENWPCQKEQRESKSKSKET